MATCWVAMMALAQAPFSVDTIFRCQLAYPHSYAPTINSAYPLPNGQVVVSGAMNYPTDTWPEHSVRRGALLNPDGSIDTTFGGYPAMGGKMVPWNDRIYVGTGQSFHRLLLNGYADPDFIAPWQDPLYTPMNFGGIHVFADGRVVYGGRATLHDTVRGFTGLHNFMWFTNTGHLDTTRIHRRGGSGIIQTIVETPDGKFIISCGMCVEQEGIPVNKVFRLHADGALDTTFHSPITWGRAFTITPLEDGRILCSGFFHVEGFGSDTLSFVRLLPDGALDPTFNNTMAPEPFGFPLPSLGHNRLPDGRLVIHGQFASLDGEPRQGIAITDQDGYLLDMAFTGTGCGTFLNNGLIYGGTSGLAFANDGMLYIWGAYQGFDDDPEQFLITRIYPPDHFAASVEDKEVEKRRLSIYPNPASGVVNFGFELAAPRSGAMLTVRDVTGRTIHQHRITNTQSEYIWDSRACQSGVYMVELRENGQLLMPAERLIIGE